MKKYNANIELKVSQNTIEDDNFVLEYFENDLDNLVKSYADKYGVDIRIGNFHEELPTIAERHAEHLDYARWLQNLVNDPDVNLPKERQTIVVDNKVVAETLDWLEDHCKHPFRTPTNHSDFNYEVLRTIKLIRETYIEGAENFVA